jgi:hypothetical protein
MFNSYPGVSDYELIPFAQVTVIIAITISPITLPGRDARC